jgi:hypothetical protein
LATAAAGRSTLHRNDRAQPGFVEQAAWTVVDTPTGKESEQGRERGVHRRIGVRPPFTCNGQRAISGRGSTRRVPTWCPLRPPLQASVTSTGIEPSTSPLARAPDAPQSESLHHFAPSDHMRAPDREPACFTVRQDGFVRKRHGDACRMHVFFARRRVAFKRAAYGFDEPRRCASLCDEGRPRRC